MAQTALKIDTDMLNQAKAYAVANSRSATKQIEYWAKIGKIAEDNADLTFNDIKDILVSLEQSKQGLVTPYVFG